MSLTLTVPQGYGYSVLIALGVIPVMGFTLGGVVGPLRKKAGVAYPNPYATAEQAKESQDAYKFNCAQRSHGNFLENGPQTMAFILFAGLFYPQATPLAGLAWCVQRAMYSYGYIAGSKPNGGSRLIGSGMWLAQGLLWGLTVSGALSLI